MESQQRRPQGLHGRKQLRQHAMERDPVGGSKTVGEQLVHELMMRGRRSGQASTALVGQRNLDTPPVLVWGAPGDQPCLCHSNKQSADSAFAEKEPVPQRALSKSHTGGVREVDQDVEPLEW
jgi:hypothetical protein